MDDDRLLRRTAALRPLRRRSSRGRAGAGADARSPIAGRADVARRSRCAPPPKCTRRRRSGALRACRSRASRAGSPAGCRSRSWRSARRRPPARARARRPPPIRAGSRSSSSQHFPGHDLTVLNRGVNGEEAADMLARFETDVIAEKPDLVLWQVGTNSVLRDHPLDCARRSSARGHRAPQGDRRRRRPDRSAIRAAGARQGRAPRRWSTPIAAIAKQEKVDLFQPLRRDAPLARGRAACRSTTFVSPRRPAHERLELCLPRQVARRGDRRRGQRGRPRPRRLRRSRRDQALRRRSQQSRVRSPTRKSRSCADVAFALRHRQRRDQILDHIVGMLEPA